MLARARFTRSGAVARRSVRPVAARVSVPRRLYSSKRPLPFEPKDGGLKDLVLDERRDEDLLRLFKYDREAELEDDFSFLRGRTPSKREITRTNNLNEMNVEIDEETGSYFIGQTRVPSHLDHWLEDPYGVKSPRDKYLQQKWEKMQKRAAEKEQLALLKGDKEGVSNKMSRRMLRVGAMLKNQLNNLLSDPPMTLTTVPRSSSISAQYSTIFSRAFVTITRVEMSSSLMHAKVFWTCLPGYETQVSKEFNALNGKIRHIITHKMNLKYSPELKFIRDAPTQRQMEALEAVNLARIELLTTFGIGTGYNGENGQQMKSDLPALDIGFKTPGMDGRPASIAQVGGGRFIEKPPPGTPTPAQLSEWLSRTGLKRK